MFNVQPINMSDGKLNGFDCMIMQEQEDNYQKNKKKERKQRRLSPLEEWAEESHWQETIHDYRVSPNVIEAIRKSGEERRKREAEEAEKLKN